MSERSETFLRGGVLGLVGSLCMIFAFGCLGRSPEVERYMLGAPAAASPSRSADSSASGVAILVGPVVLPAYLERSQLARLEDGGEIELDEFSRWLGGFEKNFLRGISLGLARELDSVKVVPSPSSAPFPLDYRIRLHVDDLVFVAPRNVLRVRIRWALIAEESESPARLFLLETEIPVEAGGNAGLVRAHEAAIARLVSEIAQAVR